MPCERNELSHYTCTNIHEQCQGHAKHDQVSRWQQRAARWVTSPGITTQWGWCHLAWKVAEDKLQKSVWEIQKKLFIVGIFQFVIYWIVPDGEIIVGQQWPHVKVELGIKQPTWGLVDEISTNCPIAAPKRMFFWPVIKPRREQIHWEHWILTTGPPENTC